MILTQARDFTELLARPQSDRIVLRNGEASTAKPPDYAELDGLEGLVAMSQAYDIAALRAEIGPIKWEDNPILVKQKSRDFYWYSPVLKRELEAVTADVVVSPTSESEVADRPRRRLSGSGFRSLRAARGPAIMARRCRSWAACS